MPRNPNCRDCDLYKTSKTVCVWGDGPSDAKVVVIGEAPGEAEARTGKPFMGKSGQLLRSELDSAQVRDVYITNIVKCRPPDNRTPTNEEIKACRKYLDEELAEIKPKYVLTVGSPASKTVLKISKITQDHGKLVQMPGYMGVPAYHPAYCLRDPSKLPVFQQDLARLGRAIRGEVQNKEIQWDVVTRDNLEEFVREFEAAEEFAYDLETSGLFPFDRKGFIRCVGIAFWKRTWIIPVQRPGAIFYNRPSLFKRFMGILFSLARRKKKRSIAHNGKFDNHWLYYYAGGTFRLSFDTMLAHHTLDENADHDLKSLSRGFLDVEEYDISTKEKQGNTTDEKLFEYCAKDTAYTLQLSRIFRRRLKKDPAVWRLFTRLVMPAARALGQIEREGLTIDQKRMTEIEHETRRRRNRLEQELNKIAGKRVNWNSPQQVSKVLYGDFKIKCVEFTDKGNPSTSESAILHLKGTHPIADKLIEYREVEKFLNTYIDGWKEFMVGDKLFVSYKIHGTVTGRYSSRIHSIPRDGKIRNLVTAPPGWRFVQGDIATAEMRIAAIESGDQELISCFRRGIDVHWRTLLFTLQAGAAGDYVKPAIETAFRIRQGVKGFAARRPSLSDACEILLKTGHEAVIELDKTWKEGRKKAKAINFGFIYGMFAKKFIETCRMKYGFEPTMEEAEAARNAYFHLYRGLKTWHDRQKKLVKLDGFVRNLAGRLRRLPGIHSSDWSVKSECERQAINSPIQGFIGDFKAMALVEIQQTVPRDKFRLVGEHHDALLGIVREDAIEEVLPQVRKIMRRPALIDEFGIDLTVPMEADLEIGNWGAGKAWKPKQLD